MKIFAILLLTISAAFAAPLSCQPNTTTDSQALALACYGTDLVALPGSTWFIGYNDNTLGDPQNDFDANDVVATAAFNSTGTIGLFTITAGMSAHVDYLAAGSTFLFFNTAPVGTTASAITTPNASVQLFGTDTFTGNTYSSPGSSFVIGCITGCGTPSPVPEPSTVLLAAVPLFFIVRRVYGSRS